MILQTIGLSKYFDGLAALVDVNLSVAAGEIFGIAGPNGAGKSTLFNVMAGVYPASSGKIIFDGHDITHLKAYRICHLGLGRTFQIPRTFPTLSVYDNLLVGASFGTGPGSRRKSFSPPKDTIEKVLEFLDLGHLRNSPATNLDIYTMKLVMLGGVLASHCKVILLDEPLAGLSIAEIKDFLELIKKISQALGITVVMIEHLLDVLIDISHRILILHNGHEIYVGAPEGVRESQTVIKVYLGQEDESDGR